MTVPSHLFVQPLRRDVIKSGKVGVEDNAKSADQKNPTFQMRDDFSIHVGILQLTEGFLRNPRAKL